MHFYNHRQSHATILRKSRELSSHSQVAHLSRTPSQRISGQLVSELAQNRRKTSSKHPRSKNSDANGIVPSGELLTTSPFNLRQPHNLHAARDLDELAGVDPVVALREDGNLRLGHVASFQKDLPHLSNLAVRKCEMRFALVLCHKNACIFLTIAFE